MKQCHSISQKNIVGRSFSSQTTPILNKNNVDDLQDLKVSKDMPQTKEEIDDLIENDLSELDTIIVGHDPKNAILQFMDEMKLEKQSWPDDTSTVYSVVRSEAGYRITLRFDFVLDYDYDQKTQDFTIHLQPLRTQGEANQIALGCYIGKNEELCVETLNFPELNTSTPTNPETPSDSVTEAVHSAFPLYWDDLSDDVQHVFGMFLNELQINTRLSAFIHAVGDQGRLKHHQKQLQSLQRFIVHDHPQKDNK